MAPSNSEILRQEQEVSMELADYLVISHYLDCQHLYYYTFFPKSEKPIKAVIRHLLADTLAEDISNALVVLGFDIISVKQMTSRKNIRDAGTQITNLPLFLVALPPEQKNSKNIFKLSNLCNIIIKVEAYRTQNRLKHCHNCPQFGDVLANCKQPPRFLWCGRGPSTHGLPRKRD
jgi:hypothetical protein